MSLRYCRSFWAARICKTQAQLNAIRIRWKQTFACGISVWSKVWPRKTVFHGVLPVCFLVISVSSVPPTMQLQLKATSSLRAGTKGTLIYLLPIMSCQRESLFRHSSTPFRPPTPYRDFFRSTCTPNISQRIFFPFLKRWGQDVEDGHVAPPRACAHIHTCSASLCPRSQPRSI